MFLRDLSAYCLVLSGLLGCASSADSPSDSPSRDGGGDTEEVGSEASDDVESNASGDAGDSTTSTSEEGATSSDGGASTVPTECLSEEGDDPDSLPQLGCEVDFLAVAAEPLDSSLPGALSAKVIIDRVDNSKIYFQNSTRYPIHYNFASTHLSAVGDLPAITDQAAFNENYYSEQRRFYLGAVTYYSGPEKWVFDIAPYDNASPEMIAEAYGLITQATYFGAELLYHPNGTAAEDLALELPPSVKVITTEQLYEGIDYQPLNLGETVGPIKFVNAVDLETAYVTARDIVILDAVPNDITPVNGIITEDFQTPLSHINVLARTRGTPNMALRGARTNPKIADLVDGQHVRLIVGAFDFEVIPVSVEESNEWWDANRPPPVVVAEPDLTVTDLRDIEEVTEHTDEYPYVTIDAIRAATRAFGAKAANYSVFSTDPAIPSKKAFAIPVYYYDQFMRQHGLYDRVEELRQDPEFVGDDAVRDAALLEIRETILTGEVDQEFQLLLKEKLDRDFPERAMRFRSSTNAEDIDGFPCAGCYDSHTGDPAEHEGDQLAGALEAIRKTWSTVWNLRTYDERELRSISHSSVAMALLVHTNFPEEEANGVAITNNFFDLSGNTPGFYVNVQEGGTFEVVHPPAGISSDSFLYQYSFPNQPIIYYTHSNIVPDGDLVLTSEEVQALGSALSAINTRFQNAYGTADFSWWALEVDFKYDDELDPGGKPALYIKQVRPYPKGATSE